MARHDPRIDAYVVRSAAFAQPILEHLRATVQKACPNRVKPGMEHASLQLQGVAAVHDVGVHLATPEKSLQLLV